MSQQQEDDTDQQRWNDVRKDFETLVFKNGIAEIARRVHVHRVTVYRLLNGKTRRPSGPLRAAVEDIVANATPQESKVEE